jgi:hypothetical protein
LTISEDPRPVNVKLTGEVILPSSSVLLPPRDDAAEYDDSGDTCHFQDNPKYVYDDSVINKNISFASFSHYTIIFFTFCETTYLYVLSFIKENYLQNVVSVCAMLVTFRLEE